MAYLIQTAETNAFLQLAKFVADLLGDGEGGRTALADTPASKFVEDGETLIAKQQHRALLDLLISQSALVFSKAMPQDVDTYLTMISPHLLSRIPEEEADEAAAAVCSALSSDVDDHAEARLQGLTQVFNTVHAAKQRLNAFVTTCTYAQRAGLASLPAPVVKAGVDNWLKELDLSPVDERRFLFAAAELLRSSKKKQRSQFARDAFRFNQRALMTLKEGDKADMPEVLEAAAAVVIDFVRFQDVFQFDLADCPGIKMLEGHPKYKGLYTLLHLLLDADVKGLTSFAEQHADVLETCQSSQDDVLTKGRMMAILALGAHGPAVPLSTVQAALDCPEEEVEGWIVRAIGRNLIEGRIDQLQRLLTITRTTHRAFTFADWSTLASQLRVWQDAMLS